MSGELHTRIGGQTAVEDIADDFIDRLSGDAAYSSHFGSVDIPALKTKAGTYLFNLWGGSTTADNAAAVAAHAGLGLTRADFDAAIAHLQAALEAYTPAIDAVDIEAAVWVVQSLPGLAVTDWS